MAAASLLLALGEERCPVRLCPGSRSSPRPGRCWVFSNARPVWVAGLVPRPRALGISLEPSITELTLEQGQGGHFLGLALRGAWQGLPSAHRSLVLQAQRS